MAISYVHPDYYWKLTSLEMCTILSESQNHKCCFCGTVMFLPYPVIDALHPATAADIILYKRFKASIEHIHPKSKGGTDEWENLAASCIGCNADKADDIVIEEPVHDLPVQ